MNEGKRQAYSTNLIQLLIKHVGASLRARALLNFSSPPSLNPGAKPIWIDRRYPEEDEDLSPDEEMETTNIERLGLSLNTFILQRIEVEHNNLEGRGRPGLGGQMRGLPHKDRLLGARIVFGVVRARNIWNGDWVGIDEESLKNPLFDHPVSCIQIFGLFFPPIPIDQKSNNEEGLWLIPEIQIRIGSWIGTR
ncbi:hypothetical protein ACJX0J_000345 (mitochondrion) [Zea mays]